MVGGDLLSNARLTWKPLEALAWLAATRGAVGVTEGVGASSRGRAKGRARATRMALVEVRAKGRAIRMARPEGKGRAIRTALPGAEDRATRMALAEVRVPKVVGVVVDSKLYPPGVEAGVEAGVAMVPGCVAALDMFLSKLSASASMFASVGLYSGLAGPYCQLSFHKSRQVFTYLLCCSLRGCWYLKHMSC